MIQQGFDFEASQEAKRRGMRRAADGNSELLDFARAGLEMIARSRASREVTADDAAIYLLEHGKPSLGNAAGSLFRQGKWKFTGRWTKSTRVVSHANDLRIWRLED